MINISNVSTLLAGTAPRLFADATVKRSAMYNLCNIKPPSDQRGPRWHIKSTAAASATPFAEGAAFPSADEFETTDASMSWGSYVATLKTSGQLMDQLNAQGAQYVANFFAEQLAEAIADLVDEIDEDIRGGATTNGITGVTSHINDTGTVAGINKASVTAFQAYANSTASAITQALMDDVHQNLVDARLGRYDFILTSQELHDDYTALTSGNGVPAPRLALDGMTTYSAGYVGAMYRGKPIIPIPGYGTRVDFVAQDALCLEVLRPIRVSEARRVNDDFLWDITWIGQFYVPNPYKTAGTLDGVTT